MRVIAWGVALVVVSWLHWFWFVAARRGEALLERAVRRSEASYLMAEGEAKQRRRHRSVR